MSLAYVPVLDADAPIRIGGCASATAAGPIHGAKIMTPAINTLPIVLMVVESAVGSGSAACPVPARGSVIILCPLYRVGERSA